MLKKENIEAERYAGPRKGIGVGEKGQNLPGQQVNGNKPMAARLNKNADGIGKRSRKLKI